MAFLDFSMQDEKYAQTQASRPEELTNGAINLLLSSQTKEKGGSPSL